MDWGAGFEAVRPWLTTAFIASILGIVVKLYVDNRTLRLAEEKSGQDFQLQVSADGRSNLQFVIDNLVRDIKSQREAHAGCQTELADTKKRMGALEKLYEGLQRQFVNYQILVARAIPPGERSPEIDAMLVALETWTEPGGPPIVPPVIETVAVAVERAPRRRWGKGRGE